MAEFENREKRPRGAPNGVQDENSALAELSRFVDAQKNRGEQGRERRGRPSAEIRHEHSNPAERAGSQARKRYVDDDFAPIEAASARARGFRNRNAWSEPQEEELDCRAIYIDYGAAARRRLLYFTALIIVIGFVGLAASSVSWRKLSNPTETTLIGRETRGARPQPDEMADADRPPKTLPLSTHSPLTSRPTIAPPRPRELAFRRPRRRSHRQKRRRARRRRRSPPAPNMTIPAMSWRRSKKSRRGQNYCSIKRRR